VLHSCSARKRFGSAVHAVAIGLVRARSARQCGRLLRENRLTGALPANISQMSALRMLYAAIAILYLLLLSTCAPLFAGT
jgi:hypothetical protein